MQVVFHNSIDAEDRSNERNNFGIACGLYHAVAIACILSFSLYTTRILSLALESVARSRPHRSLSYIAERHRRDQLSDVGCGGCGGGSSPKHRKGSFE